MEIVLAFFSTLFSVSLARIFASKFGVKLISYLGKEYSMSIQIESDGEIVELTGLSRAQRDRFNLMSSVVGILDENDRPLGTGFLIAPQKVLTAAHILQSRNLEASIYRIRYAINGDVDYAIPQLRDRSKDIAILQAQNRTPKEATAASISLKSKLSDKQFYTFGYPYNLANGMWSNGNIRVGESPGDEESGFAEQPVLLLSAEIEPGMSGAPVMDSASGKVIGVVAGSLPRIESKQSWKATAIPIRELKDLVSQE